MLRYKTIHIDWLHFTPWPALFGGGLLFYSGCLDHHSLPSSSCLSNLKQETIKDFNATQTIEEFL
jgi:hypothetical protein